jgi:hypothetical protein
LRGVLRSSFGVPELLGCNAGADAGEGIVYLLAQEGEDQDNNDSDEDEDQSVFHQTLALLLQMLNLSAQVIIASKLSVIIAVNNRCGAGGTFPFLYLHRITLSSYPLAPLVTLAYYSYCLSRQHGYKVIPPASRLSVFRRYFRTNKTPRSAGGFVCVRVPRLLGGDAGTDAGEGIVYLLAQEGEDQDNNDSDEDEDQSILYQTLALFLQLLNLSAHFV